MNFLEEALLKREEIGMEKVRREKLLLQARNALKMIIHGLPKEQVLIFSEIDVPTYQLLFNLFNTFGAKAIEHVKVEDGKLTMK